MSYEMVNRGFSCFWDKKSCLAKRFQCKKNTRPDVLLMWQAVIRGNWGTFKYIHRVYHAFVAVLYVSFLSNQAITFPRLSIFNFIGNIEVPFNSV